MNEVVIVTTWKREELLYLCLEAIRREDEKIPICVYSDRGANSEDLRHACYTFGAQRIITAFHQNYGNSFNLLNACKFAFEIKYKSDIVHLIEDDTLIHKGYLAWAREKLTEMEILSDSRTLGGEPGTIVGKPMYAAVCGRIPSPHIPNWYESPCASWNAEHLRIALSHLVPEYFSSDRMAMQRALDEVMFPKSKWKKGGAEQDGFFLRCIEHHGWKTCFPPKPLATHLGFFGYNVSRPRPIGSFEERVQFCRDLLKDKERRKQLFGHSITSREWEGAGL